MRLTIPFFGESHHTSEKQQQAQQYQHFLQHVVPNQPLPPQRRQSHHEVLSVHSVKVSPEHRQSCSIDIKRRASTTSTGSSSHHHLLLNRFKDVDHLPLSAFLPSLAAPATTSNTLVTQQTGDHLKSLQPDQLLEKEEVGVFLFLLSRRRSFDKIVDCLTHCFPLFFFGRSGAAVCFIAAKPTRSKY